MADDFFDSIKNLPESMSRKLEAITSTGRRADAIAEREYPDSARDASTKNAFRHALGTGMLAKELGGGWFGSTAAKGAGYLWEGMGALDFLNSEDHRNDTRHDLNANALGAAIAIDNDTQERLVNRLKAMADRARTTEPPSVFETSRGYMTRSER